MSNNPRPAPAFVRSAGRKIGWWVENDDIDLSKSAIMEARGYVRDPETGKWS